MLNIPITKELFPLMRLPKELLFSFDRTLNVCLSQVYFLQGWMNSGTDGNFVGAQTFESDVYMLPQPGVDAVRGGVLGDRVLP